MTQKDKDLLLRDLSARLPYGFIVHRYCDNVDIKINTIDDFSHFLEYSEGKDFKPYLRLMSSMTKEERKIICSMNMLSDTELNDRLNYPKMYAQNYTIETFDLFNAQHLDYRGLINKGLALEAPNDMYNLKEK